MSDALPHPASNRTAARAVVTERCMFSESRFVGTIGGGPVARQRGARIQGKAAAYNPSSCTRISPPLRATATTRRWPSAPMA